jgi:hypothetical protein
MLDGISMELRNRDKEGNTRNKKQLPERFYDNEMDIGAVCCTE